LANGRPLANIADWAGTDGGYGVAIVAPYPSVRVGLRAMVEQIAGVAVIAEAADDDLDPARDPDAVIIDVDPEQLDIVERVSDSFPDTPLLLLLDSAALYHQLRSGNHTRVAALSKGAGVADIAAALAGLAQGLVVLDPAFASQPPPASSHATANGGEDALTPRERQVLELLALGLPNKTIAMELGVSEHTAKFHVGTIMSKLGAASRTEAVALAARRGLLVL